MMTDLVRLTHSADRRRQLRAKLEAQEEAEDRLDSARINLDALQRERDATAKRIERLTEHAERMWVKHDDTGLAPVPCLIVAGKFGDLIPGVERNLAQIDQQIAEVERVIKELEAAAASAAASG
jgi:chaperonin cofactor prefoldin